MTRHLLLLLPTTRIFMSSVVAAGLVSTSSLMLASIGAARENNVYNICPGRDIAWRLPGSQNQLADCPERGALPTIVMARNANGGGIRNCCQSCELLDAGKPSDGQVASTGRDLPSSSSTSPASAGNSQQTDQMTMSREEEGCADQEKNLVAILI